MAALAGALWVAPKSRTASKILPGRGIHTLEVKNWVVVVRVGWAARIVASPGGRVKVAMLWLLELYLSYKGPWGPTSVALLRMRGAHP